MSETLLCGSQIAHANCKFAGPIDMSKLMVHCSAPKAAWGACPYSDIGQYHHAKLSIAPGKEQP